MAQSYTGPEVTQIIPGATASIRVQPSAQGPAAAGIVVLVGESEQGAPFTEETDLNNNFFGPDSFQSVLSKYGSGPLVDAYQAAVNPLNDENVLGSPSRVILVKTNASTQASLALLNYASATWGTLLDKGWGENGNLIYGQVTANTAESAPSKTFTWIPTVGTCNVGFRCNGAALETASLLANDTPTAAAAAFDGLVRVSATGGALRTVIPVVIAGTLALSQVGGVATITYSATWTTTPTAGDALVIPLGSVLAGVGDANVGAYVVTSATTGTIVATKLSQAGKGGASPGDPVTGANVGATPVVATTDIGVYSPITINNLTNAGVVIDGIGKTMEVCELTSGTDLLNRAAYNLSTTKVTWVSKTGAAQMCTAVAEYAAKLALNRQLDNQSEEFIAGGDIALKIGYLGTTATVTISNTALTTTVVGGTGGNLSLTLSKYPTIADLATYINAQTGYSCAVGTTAMGQMSPAKLDNVTAQGICTQFGGYAGRIKADAQKMFEKISTSVLVQLNDPAAAPASGLPAPMANVSYMAGGAKGATTAAGFQAAITALERVRCNFVVPLFSRDATSDIADALTDSNSTYVLSSVHSLTLSHCLAMSKIKRRKNRQCVLSIKDTYANAKLAAQTMASARSMMVFEDGKVVGSDGTVQQLQPWINAAMAAGGQAAAGYKALVRKKLNSLGALQAAADWSDQDDTQVEDALLAGLNPIKRHESNGSWYWVSDQTTYSKDSNFVYNSLQAMYVADTIALSTAQRMEDAFCGQSVADVSATQALTFLESIMADFLRLKLIAPSDDAPLGFRNASVQISGPAMIVNCEVKLAGAIYFIPISFLVSQVSQTANQ